jgi:hypothetical protein
MLDVDSDEMRGLDTAAGLRQMEGSDRRTPIVGITANAAADNERERRQRQIAGIDDCLSKPILRENVKSVISRYASVATTEPLTLGWQRLVELDEAAGDRVELLSGWIDLFLSGASEELDQMRVAQEKGDAAGLCRTAGKRAAAADNSARFACRKSAESSRRCPPRAAWPAWNRSCPKSRWLWNAPRGIYARCKTIFARDAGRQFCGPEMLAPGSLEARHGAVRCCSPRMIR